MRNIQPKILEIYSGSKVEWKEHFWKKKSKIWAYFARLSIFFFEILQNAAVPFATGSCRKFKADVLGEWKLKHPRSLASELLTGEKKAIIFGCKRKTSLQVREILLVNETDKRLFDTEQIVL